MSAFPPRAVCSPQEFVRLSGALPWRINGEGHLEVLLLGPNSSGNWIIPTARKVRQQTSMQAAERSALNEAGVVGRVGTDPIGTYWCSWRRENGIVEERSVVVFGIHVWGTLRDWPRRSPYRHWWPIGHACDLRFDPGLTAILKSLRSGSWRYVELSVPRSGGAFPSMPVRSRAGDADAASMRLGGSGLA